MFIPIVCHELIGGKASGPTLQIIVNNISEKGVGFRSKTIYSVGLELQTEMYLPTRKMPIMPVIRISRVDSIVGTANYMMGASFEKILPEETDAIIECLENLDLYKRSVSKR